MPSARRRVAIAGPAPLRKVASVSSVSGGRGPPRVGSAGTKLFGDDDRVGFHTRTLGELRHTDRGTRRKRRLDVLRHDFVDGREMGEIGQEDIELGNIGQRSEEHTSELQSLMRNSYAVFCLKKKK